MTVQRRWNGTAWEVVGPGAPGSVITPELASLVSNVNFTHTGGTTFADVPGCSLLVPGNVAWECSFSLVVQMQNAASGQPANGANTYMQGRVVDAATAGIVYAWGIFQISNNAMASANFFGELEGMQPNDPLSADTVLKLQVNSSGNAGVTFSVYQASNVAGGIYVKASRR